MINPLNFRNMCAEDGVELTPQQAEKTITCYEEFVDSIKIAYEEIPNYYNKICNKTTEEKLQDIENLEKEKGCKMSLKEYNELQKTIIAVCKIEGYDE